MQPTLQEKEKHCWVSTSGYYVGQLQNYLAQKVWPDDATVHVLVTGPNGAIASQSSGVPILGAKNGVFGVRAAVEVCLQNMWAEANTSVHLRRYDPTLRPVRS